MRERWLDWRAAILGFRFQPARGRVSVASRWTLFLFPALIVLAVVVPYNILYYLAYLWGWLLLMSWAWVRYQGPRVELERELHGGWAQVGDELTEGWELRNYSWLPLLWLQVDDGSTLPGYNARRVGATGAQSTQQWITNALCTRRGRYRVGPMTLELGDPLGLFRYRRVDAQSREMIVYPPLVHLPTLQRPRGQRGGAATAALVNTLPTTNAGGLRDYRPGDPLNYIHWRAVAHTGKLVVKEFDQEVAGAIWIVLDLARDVQQGTGDEATEELGVVLACSLANLLLAEGRTVGLFARGAERRVVRPGRGRQHLWEFMSTLVDAQADGTIALRDALGELAALASGRVAAVAITPDHSVSWAGALIGLTGGGASASALLLEGEHPHPATGGRLDRIGIRHAVFSTTVPLQPISPIQRRAPGYRISPLGRAVQVES
jgi:uncharacterized protein (DUF58 family)